MFGSWVFVITIVIVNANEIDDCYKGELNSTCTKGADWPEAVCDDNTAYVDCTNGRTAKYTCMKLSGVQKRFDNVYKICLLHTSRMRRQNGIVSSVLLGSTCSQNTDCNINNGAYCNAGFCACQSNWVQISGILQCFQKINPGQSTCSYPTQCSSVWYGATCSSGICTCPSNNAVLLATTDFATNQQYFPVQTADGYVCMPPAATDTATVGACPLPYQNGVASVYTTAVNTQTACVARGSSNNCASPELYDCLPLTSTVTNTNGICCPNRAFTCSQIQENTVVTATAATSTTSTNYWYNPTTGACTPFVWNRRNTGNGNNFPSLDMCQSYCTNKCARGNAQYATSQLWYTRSWQTCSSSSSGTCSSTNFQCTSVGSNQYCCPKPSYICGINGGLVTSTGTSPNAGLTTWSGAVGDTVATQNSQLIASTTRYYYSTTTGTCVAFIYSGAGGNFNNFLTQSDCQNYCSQLLCSRGTPLKDGSGNNLACSSSGCPAAYTCTNNVCCPLAQTVCSQPKAIGSCSSFTQVWWFNPTSKACELFTYSGCGGNDNNFATQLDCQNYCRSVASVPQCIQGLAYQVSGTYLTCSLGTTGGVTTNCPANYQCYYDGANYGCCPTQAYTCSITYSTGTTCGPPTNRWYFNPTQQTCTTFQYNGCDGNSNNFASQQLCQQYCGVGGCPNGGTPYTQVTGANFVCATTGSTSCPSGYSCVTIQQSISSSIQACCPTRANICSAPPAQGINCNAVAVSRYYYNPGSRTCTTFTFNGCQGNGNNFGTLAACQNFCNSAGCQIGEGVYLDPQSQAVFQCNPTQTNSCPNGYTCRYDSLNNRNICCGGTTGGVCPASQRAYIDPSTNGVRNCLPNAVNSCPSGFICQFNVNTNQYYCCTQGTTSACQTGYAPYLSSSTSQPVACATNQLVNYCPSGYTCQTGNAGSFQGYCCTQNPVCPSGSSVYINSIGSTQSCTVGGFGTPCPSPYACQTTVSGSINGYCCSNTATCTGGGSVYSPSGTAQTCTPSFTNCPIGYSCQPSSSAGVYYCCSSPITSNFCPSGYTTYQPAGSPVVCSPSFNQCPGVNACLPSPISPSQYYCCSLGGGTQNNLVCPVGQTPYQPNGLPTTCNPSQFNICNFPYTCQPSPVSLGTYYCCSSTGVSNSVCPSGTSPYQPSGTPVSCSLTFNTCLTGYSCQASPTAIGQYYCCSGNTLTNSVCPAGTSPYQPSGFPTTCNPSFPSCQSGYSCQASPTSVGVYYCCSSSGVSNSVCPAGTSPYQPSGFPTTCNPSFPSCQSGYSCQASPTAPGVYYCCSGGSTLSTVCPTGATPYQPAGSPVSCSPTFTGSCPSPTYSCQPSPTQIGQYYCCTGSSTSTSVGRAGCPPGSDTIPPGSFSPQTCSPFTANSCPNGYGCQFSSTLSQYVCCGSTTTITGGCPAGSAPFVNPLSGQTQACTPNLPGSCQIGYACQFTSTGQYLCCGSAISISSATCPNGLIPLQSQPGSVQTCSGQSCPYGYTCTPANGQQVCCPIPAMACKDAQSSGTTCPTAFSQPSTNYFYNSQSQSCQQFSFFGCGGSMNNFNSLSSCQSTCQSSAICQVGLPAGVAQGGNAQSCSSSSNCPSGYFCTSSFGGNSNQQICCPNAQSVCTQPQTFGGNCGTTSTSAPQRYFFNAQSSSCQSYSGCQGNDNSFNSQSDCQNFCLQGMCTKGVPLLSGNSPQTCQLGGFNSCPNGFSCSSPRYGNSGQQICCPSPANICAQPSNQGQSCSGSSSSAQVRYYYSSNTGSCQTFTFFGCNGNDNRFESLNECQQFCSGIGGTGGNNVCPNGQQPYSQFGQPQSCSIGGFSVCPGGYSCQQSSTGLAYCCPGGTTTNSQCPAGSTTAMYPGTSLPLVCNSFSGNCPSGYRCNPGPNGVSYCCSNVFGSPTVTGSNGCPSGNAYLQPGSFNPQQCNLNTANSCPFGYTCTYSTTNFGYQCCSGRTFRTYENLNVTNSNNNSQTIDNSISLRNGPCNSNEVQCPNTCGGVKCPRLCQLSCPSGCSNEKGICWETLPTRQRDSVFPLCNNTECRKANGTCLDGNCVCDNSALRYKNGKCLSAFEASVQQG